MEIVKLNCNVCENKCSIEAEVEDGEVMDVDGNGCMKGFSFAQRYIRDLEENGN